jgi:hypothetical protein
VVVNAAPELTIPADAEFCQYSTVQLLAEGSGNIVWNNALENGSSYQLNDSQSLIALSTGENGCTAQAVWNIEALPLPSAETLVVGQQIIALDGDAWQWFLNGVAIEGASSNSYTMTQEGTYSVEVTSINGCSNMSDFTYYVLEVEEASSLGIRVYPNPMENELRIDLPEQGFYSIELRDMTGRLVVARAQCQTTCILQREGNAAGIYELLIKGEGVMAHQRVVLK